MGREKTLIDYALEEEGNMEEEKLKRKPKPVLMYPNKFEVAGEKPDEEESRAIYIEFEKRDEEQIKKEILGETLEEYFYQFEQKGRKITGLSIKGVNELIRIMGNVQVMEPKIKEKKDRYEVKVEAKDLLRNLISWGVSQQSKKLKFSGGGEMDDEFALQKCFSKARRNALRPLIPETFVSKMLEKWKERKEQHKKDAQAFMPDK